MTGGVCVLYLFSCGALGVVDGAAAGVAGRVIHHTVCSTHRVIELSDTTTAGVTANGQVLL